MNEVSLVFKLGFVNVGGILVWRMDHERTKFTTMFGNDLLKAGGTMNESRKMRFHVVWTEF